MISSRKHFTFTRGGSTIDRARRVRLLLMFNCANCGAKMIDFDDTTEDKPCHNCGETTVPETGLRISISFDHSDFPELGGERAAPREDELQSSSLELF